jgi:hypothetical protein
MYTLLRSNVIVNIARVTQANPRRDGRHELAKRNTLSRTLRHTSRTDNPDLFIPSFKNRQSIESKIRVALLPPESGRGMVRGRGAVAQQSDAALALEPACTQPRAVCVLHSGIGEPVSERMLEEKHRMQVPVNLFWSPGGSMPFHIDAWRFVSGYSIQTPHGCVGNTVIIYWAVCCLVPPCGCGEVPSRRTI